MNLAEPVPPFTPDMVGGKGLWTSQKTPGILRGSAQQGKVDLAVLLHLRMA